MKEKEILAPDFRDFFEQTPDLVGVSNREGYFRFVNKAMEEKLGYTEAELMKQPIASFILPDDREITAFRRTELFNGTPLLNFENRYVSKNGSVIWLHWTSIYIPGQDLVFGLAKDITEKKRQELEITEKYETFRYLTHHFKENIEKDREYFALELHEDLAQLASVIKLNVHSAMHAIPDLPDDVKNHLNYAAFISALMIRTIRKISFEISPYVFDEYGLGVLLQRLCDNFSAVHDISCDLIMDFKEESFTQDLKTDIFRICQEVLRIIKRHSHPHSVSVHIKDRDGLLELKIMDDGKGFASTALNEVSGLQNVRDRVLSMHGKIFIERGQEKGLIIQVEVKRSVNPEQKP